MQRLVLRNVYNCGEDTSHDHGHWDIGALLEAAPAGKIVVGRNESASIQIDSTLLPAMISRRHAELHCDHEGAIFLTDRQSMNGTWCVPPLVALLLLRPAKAQLGLPAA